jgi:cell division protein FtsB
MTSLERKLKELTDSVESYERRSRKRAIFFSLVLPAVLLTLYIGLSIWQVNQLEQRKRRLEEQNKKLNEENITLVQETSNLTKKVTEAKGKLESAKEGLNAINFQLGQAKRSSNDKNLQDSLSEIERRATNVDSTITAVAKDLERYQKTVCGSIFDSRTELEWYVGPNQNMTWDKASNWAGSLTACGGRWRIPKIEELKPLYNKAYIAGKGHFAGGQYFPARMAPVFNGIGGGAWVWAEEGNQGNAFNFHENLAVSIPRNNPDQFSVRAFAVRSK